MSFVFETVNTVSTSQSDIGLGVQLSNANSIFKTLYTVPDQTKENLKALLLTRIGERYMLPEFGTNLLNIVFQPNVSDLRDEIDNIIRGPINTWLPYITIEELDVKTIEDDPTMNHTIEISLTYTVQDFSTNTIKIFVSDESLSVV
jgi:phage baseplate assembly protein W